MNRERILELLAGKNFAALKEALAHANSVDLAVLLEEVEEKELLLVFRLLGKEEAAETFSYMSSNLQQMIIQEH